MQIKKATVLIKKIKTIANKKEPTLYFYKIDSAITILNFKMGERSKLDVRGFESPKLPKQAKYIYGFVTKNGSIIKVGVRDRAYKKFQKSRAYSPKIR